MFRVTALGHHSWLLASGRSHLLVDPLLQPHFGLTAAVGLHVYPPRRLDLAAFPPLDGVMITHEHEGHFEPASLHLLDRSIPIHVSSRSSNALSQCLREMGFTVRSMKPGVGFDVGDLSVLPMTADQIEQGIIDEWDVLPYLVYDRAGDGNFFTHVDMGVDDRMWRAAREVVPRPGLFSHTTNAHEWTLHLAWGVPEGHELERQVREIVRHRERLAHEWALPAALPIVGQGFCFGGDRGWLNESVFPYEADALAAALRPLLPRERIVVPIPGETFVMERGELVAIEPKAAFVESRPRAEWPRRRAGAIAWLEDYPPVTGRVDITDEDLAALRSELDRFAAYLYAGQQFRACFSLGHEDRAGREPTVAIVARAGDGAYVFAYEPQGCRFVPASTSDPAGTYLGVFECWASDLLAALRAEVSANSLFFARSRIWNANPAAFELTLDQDLFMYAHPLRHPSRFLALYRALLNAQPEPAVRIRAAGR